MKTPICILSALMAAISPSPSEVPQMIHYQGRVSVGGTNFDGAGQFQFALVGPSGSPLFWSNGTSTIGLTVSKGLFSVLLGDTNLAGMAQPIPSALFTNGDVRLRVWFNDGINGTQLLSPDPRIGSVGYAMVAARADTASSLPAGSDVTGLRLNIGSGNTLAGALATIAGGSNNVASGTFATIGGGQDNTAADYATTVGGGSSNTASNYYATVAGGDHNTADGYNATVAGGHTNTAGGYAATVGGGSCNTAGGYAATVGGGFQNTASNYYATVAGGIHNTADGYAATVGGGYYNTASNNYATVAGGCGNAAGGWGATIPGGDQNAAMGTNSFAAGCMAKALHPGAFVWADNRYSHFASTTNDQFTARCAGGVRFFSEGTATIGVQLAAGGNAWSAISDRNAKENFSPVDCNAVLEKLAAIPVTTWNLKSQDASIRHIGPMAQDFMAAFDVGEDDRHISTSDADGVALAAIQGLYEMGRTHNETTDRLLKEKGARIADLEQRLKILERRLDTLANSPRPAFNQGM